MHMMRDVWYMWSAVVCTCLGILARLPERFSCQSPPPCQVAAVLAGCSLGAVDQTWHDGGKRPPKKISPLHPLGQESLSSHTHTIAHMHHASCALWLSGTPVLGILSQYQVTLHWTPCHSSDFRRTPKLKLSSKQNWNLAAIWGLSHLGPFQALLVHSTVIHWWCWNYLAYWVTLPA